MSNDNKDSKIEFNNDNFDPFNKSELDELKVVTSTERKKINVKTKKTLKRQYINIGITVGVLIILVGLLIFVISRNPDVKMDVPDTPSYDKLEVGIVDFDENGNSNDLSKSNGKTAKVSYKVVSDYYKNNIMLGGNVTDYVNDRFIVRSSEFAQPAFISSITKDSKLEWIAKIEDKTYDKYVIRKVVYFDNSYYAFMECSKKDKKAICGVKVGTNGKINDVVTIDDDSYNNINNVIVKDNTLVVITSGQENLEIFYLDNKLKPSTQSFRLADSLSNIFLKYSASVTSSTIDGDNIVMTIKDSSTSKQYIVTMKLFDTNVTIDEFVSANSVEKLKSNVLNSNKYIYLLNEKKLNYFTFDGQLQNYYDYSQLKLEDESEYEGYISVEDYENGNTGNKLQNDIFVNRFSVLKDNVMVYYDTNINRYYDVFDNNLKLLKRFKINRLAYQYDEATLLDAYYVDGKVYEIYSFGYTTPSILISTVELGE